MIRPKKRPLRKRRARRKKTMRVMAKTQVMMEMTGKRKVKKAKQMKQRLKRRRKMSSRWKEIMKKRRRNKTLMRCSGPATSLFRVNRSRRGLLEDIPPTLMGKKKYLKRVMMKCSLISQAAIAL
jgi:ATPase subunit of ABC transporter with duplicated ATPase domains